MTDPLKFTGERFTPECVREIRYEHVHRYAFAADLVRDLDVLDAACGEGYGADLLARQAHSVIGIDISAEVIAHAANHYRADNLSFRAADCCELSFDDGQFGAVVSFETLEHLEEQEKLLQEFRRVLADDGFLIISSPDKAVYTDRQNNRNPYHVRELYRDELEALLARQFPAVRLLGQRLAFNSLIWPVAPASGAGPASCLGGAAESAVEETSGLVAHRELEHGIERLHGPAGEAVYLIALCARSAAVLPRIAAALWLFDDAEESVYRHYHHEIRKNMDAGALLRQREQEIAALQAADSRPGHPEGSGSPPWWRRWLGRR